MAFFIRAFWYDQYGNIVELDFINSIRVQRNTNAKNNKLELSLKNYHNRFVYNSEVVFKAGDSIKIYVSRTSLDTLSNNKLLGIFKLLNHSIAPDDKLIKLVCGDFTYDLMSRLFTGDLTGTAPEMVANIVQTTNEDGLTQTPLTVNITGVKSDGSGFVEKQYAGLWKTAYEAVSAISQTDYTDDTREYIFWFDPDNTFNWTFLSLSPEATEFLYGNSPIKTMTFERAEADAITMIIYNAGNDLNDSAIVNFYLNPEAGSLKNSIKYQPMTTIADAVRSRFSAGELETMNNNDFITLCESVANAEAKRIITKTGQGLWTSKVIMSGNNYVPGKLYKVGASDDGFANMSLRLVSVIDRIDNNGWVTELSFEEDISEES